MKILLAGDSFAELSGYRNHFTSSGYTDLRTDEGASAGASATVTHWVELLAEEYSAEVVTHGIPGAGVSSSAFVAMQQLLTKEYDAMVFIISHHARSILHPYLVAQTDLWETHVKPMIEFENGIDVYTNNTMYKNDIRNYEKFHATDPVEIYHANAQDIIDGSEPRPVHLQYLRSKAGYSYIHDAVTSVIALKQLAETLGVDIVFASAFSQGVDETIKDMGIPFKSFKFWEVEVAHEFACSDMATHYTSNQHAKIYKTFKRLYPEYRTMFKSRK